MARPSVGARITNPTGARGATRRPGKNSEAAQRSHGGGDPATRSWALPRVGLELYLLAGLFLLTATLARTFSKLELGFSWLHPTEVVIGVALIIALVRTPLGEWVARLRATRAVIPLVILWVFGAIAAVRGLTDWGFSLVLHDIGLVEYSVLVPALAIVIRNRLEFTVFCRVIALGGVLAMVAYGATLWTPLEWHLARELNLISPATGMYLGLFVAWVLAMKAGGSDPPIWQYPVAVLGVAMIILGAARSAWVGLLGGLLIVVAFTVLGRRLALAGAVVAVLGLGVALSVPAERVHFGTPPTSGAPPPESSPNPGAVREIQASFQESSQGANSSWRLAFWSFMVEETAGQPLLGAGFGAPTSFEWNGIFYDRRTGNPDDPFDVSGPHNSFVHVLYRTGVPGLLALIALMALAVVGLIPIAKRADQSEDRSLAIWLLAALGVTSAIASFAVVLEGPFMGIFFWAVLGLALLAPQMLGRPGASTARPS